MGQTSLQTLNRVGSKSFWNSSWDNKYLYQDFFFKFLIFEKIIHTIINKKSYSSIVLSLTSKTKNNIYIFKNLKRKIIIKDDDSEIYNDNICKSKLWVFKYHNWIVLSIFILMPYKHHKLVKRPPHTAEHRIKKKKFKIASLKKKKKFPIKNKGINKNKASRAASKFKKKTTLKSSFIRKNKAKKHRILTNNSPRDFKINTLLYIKNPSWVDNAVFRRAINKVKIKKLIPLHFYKSNIKNIQSCLKKKLKEPYDLTRNIFKKRTPTRKNLSKPRAPLREKILKKKKYVVYKFFKKNPYTLTQLNIHTKTYVSLHLKFLKKFILFKLNLLHYKQRSLKLNKKPKQKLKLFNKKTFFIKPFNKTNKILSYKNSYFNKDFYDNSKLLKKNFLKKQINFYKNKKTNKKITFEKSLFFKLNMLLTPSNPQRNIYKGNLCKNRINFKKLHKILKKKKKELTESKAQIHQTMCIKNLYNYL